MNPTCVFHSEPSARARIGVLGCGLALMGYLTRNLGLGDYGLYALAIVLVNWAPAAESDSVVNLARRE